MATLYWFTNDLRVSDNSLLAGLVQANTRLYCCFVIDTAWFKPSSPFCQSMGLHRWTFLKQTLIELKQALTANNIQFKVFFGEPKTTICDLIDELGITTLACANQVTHNEHQQLAEIKQTHPQLAFRTAWLHTLFDQHDINESGGVSGSFSTFRRKIEASVPYQQITPSTQQWQATQFNTGENKQIASDDLALAMAQFEPFQTAPSASTGKINDQVINGGCQSGQQHLSEYFLSNAASHYKETRNALQGLRQTTLFSPWLAQGCLSPKQIWQATTDYEQNVEKNESTYWIKFELLWREYFQWLALKQGPSLFAFQGIAKAAPNTSFYPQRYQKWCVGSTPYPLVNALMKQLNATGFMSNRGRQIVASCFVNELQLDWRYGASYFEQQLIDYDAASNWGNWQYIAGVGSDPRGGRWFNLEKQTQTYDAQGDFILTWQGEQNLEPLDSVDSVDWPMSAVHVD